MEFMNNSDAVCNPKLPHFIYFRNKSFLLAFYNFLRAPKKLAYRIKKFAACPFLDNIEVLQEINSQEFRKNSDRKTICSKCFQEFNGCKSLPVTHSFPLSRAPPGASLPTAIFARRLQEFEDVSKV